MDFGHFVCIWELSLIIEVLPNKNTYIYVCICFDKRRSFVKIRRKINTKN